MSAGGINRSQPLAATAPQAATPLAQPEPAAAAAPEPLGEPAWNNEWAAKFRAAGIPEDVIRSFTITGALGSDAQQLQWQLDEANSQIDSQLATFANAYPDEFLRLRGRVGLDRAQMLALAQSINSGEVPPEQVEARVEAVAQEHMDMMKIMVYPTIAYALVPGYGLLNVGASAANDGVDVLTKEDSFGPALKTFTAMGAAGGAFTVANHVAAASLVRKGLNAAAQGGDAAAIAAAHGYGNLAQADRIRSYIPGTKQHGMFNALGRLDDIKGGVSKLSGIERELAQNVLDRWKRGEISVVGDAASSFGKAGYNPNFRAILVNRWKEMASAATDVTIPTIHLDMRLRGSTFPAHLASVGVDVADQSLRARLVGGAGTGANLDPAANKLLRSRILGSATNQLLEGGHVQRPTAPARLREWLRPGPLRDAVQAADDVTNGTVGKLRGFARVKSAFSPSASGVSALGRLPGPVKLLGLAAAGAGVGFLGVSMFGGGGPAPTGLPPMGPAESAADGAAAVDTQPVATAAPAQ